MFLIRRVKSDKPGARERAPGRPFPRNCTLEEGSVPATVRLSATLDSGNGFVELTLTGAAGQTYDILTSTNLVDWTPLGSVTNSTGTAVYRDATAMGLDKRFYQARKQGATLRD